MSNEHTDHESNAPTRNRKRGYSITRIVNRLDRCMILKIQKVAEQQHMTFNEAVVYLLRKVV